MPPAPTRTTHAERALLWSLHAWTGTVDPSFWGRFHPDWRERLTAAWEEANSQEVPADTSLASLRRAHAAGARPDPGHVHPSWWVRALREESPSVQRALASTAEPELRSILQLGLNLDPAEITPAHRPDPDAQRWTLGLWSERIVGDLAEWPDDPPVILALSRHGFRVVVDLAKAVGLAKAALSGVDPPPLRGRAGARFAAFQEHWGEADAASQTLSRRDAEPFLPGRRWVRLGLVTFGRLLARVEPYRARWALQHLPYDVARLVRRSIKDFGRKVAAWESEILRIARQRLIVEGRLREHNAGRPQG